MKSTSDSHIDELNKAFKLMDFYNNQIEGIVELVRQYSDYYNTTGNSCIVITAPRESNILDFEITYRVIECKDSNIHIKFNIKYRQRGNIGCIYDDGILVFPIEWFHSSTKEIRKYISEKIDRITIDKLQSTIDAGEKAKQSIRKYLNKYTNH